MASQFSKALCAAVIAAGLAGMVAPAAQTPAPSDRAQTAKRAGDRLRQLLGESDALAAQQSKLLVELDTLDKDRRAKVADLQRIHVQSRHSQTTATPMLKHQAAAIGQR